MKHTKSLMVLAGAALGLSSAALAQQSSDTLSAQQRELQSDAKARSSYAADAGGPTINFSGYTQFQYNLNWRDDGPKNANITGTNSITDGFRFANTKLIAQGDIAEQWSYKLQAAWNSTGTFTLNDMYGQYTMDNGWNVQFGQKKLPFMHEELVADTAQQGAERSVINEEYTLGRSQGVFVNYKAEEFRIMAAFSDGANAQNTEINNTVNNANSAQQADYAFTGRGEYKWAGDWDRFDGFSSWTGNENAGMFGAAAHYQNGGGTVGTADVSGYGFTADVSVAGSGWNVYGSAVWRKVTPAQGNDVADLGLLVQGGWFVADDWELYGRITWDVPDDNDANFNVAGNQERDNFSTFAFGANWFITPRSQNAKFTIELMYAPTETIASNGASNYPGFNAGANMAQSGVLTDAEGGQLNVRAQLQLIF